MAFDWKDYIAIAEQLVSYNNPTDAQMRSATSRAYYGAFHLCRLKKGIQTGEKTPDIHKVIINSYKNSDDQTERSIGVHLFNLRHNRNEADYDGFYAPQKKETVKHIQKANSI